MANTAIALVLSAATLSGSADLEGRWANPKKNVIVRVDQCGQALCGHVVWSSTSKKKKNVRPGVQVLSELKARKNGTYKGRVYLPARDKHASATVTRVGPDTIEVKGCALAGLICKRQRWTKVGS